MKSLKIILYKDNFYLLTQGVRDSIVVKYPRLSRGRPGFDSPSRSFFDFFDFLV